MIENLPLLTLHIFSPLLGALFIFLFLRDEKIIKISALSVSLVGVALSLYLYFNFLEGVAHYQFEDKFAWFKGSDIYFHIGVDSISLPFVLLTNFLIFIGILCSWDNIKHRVKEYMVMFLVMQSLIIGAFVAVDVILFYIFFEAVLIPMFFIIGIWGGERRVYAAYKFFLYTLFGSIFLLISIIHAYQLSGSSSMIEMTNALPRHPLSVQKMIWIGFFMSFAIKIPMWPFHTWLPDAHVQAPTAGSVVLAGILLKMGGYGFIRLSLFMLPEASNYFFDFVSILSMVAIIYASFLAFRQTNIKKLIAYSSVAHMGYVTIAIFAGNLYGIHGAMFQMISHGLISAGLFLMVGMLSDRFHTKEIGEFGGLAKTMPKFTIILAVFVFSSVALPGTSGFIGEFLALIAVYKVNVFYAFIAASGMVFGAVYMLRLYKMVALGNKNPDKKAYDLNGIEFYMLLSIVVLVLILGIYPSVVTNIVDPVAKMFVENF
jgi:NADH-quinone oxidoreductase subunit M